MVDIETAGRSSSSPGRQNSGGATPVEATAQVHHGRIDFLDGLRGFAALAVVVEHASEGLWPGFAEFAQGWFKLGLFGVIIFFLISGYIIPASLERRASLREFWIGRLFRLFPLYVSVLAVALLVHYTVNRFELGAAYLQNPIKNTAINLTMLQSIFGRPLAIGASWTLAYELVFYGLVTALFVARLHRRSVVWAALFVLGSVLAGTVLDHLRGHKPAVLGLAVLVVAGLVCAAIALRGSITRRMLLALLLAVALLPLVASKQYPVWFSLALFATMFGGTVVYRYVTGTCSLNRLRLVVSGLVATGLVSLILNKPYEHDPYTGAAQGPLHPLPLTFGAAVLVFTVAFRLRRHAWPRWTLWLGRVSYSVYLVHGLVLGLLHWTPASQPGRVALLVLQVAVTIVVAAGTYRWVERPAQRLGRRLIARSATAVRAAGQHRGSDRAVRSTTSV